MKILTQDDVLGALRRNQGDKSLRQFAVSLGVSAAFLSDVYNKNRQPGKRLLKFLGMVKQTTRTTVYFELNGKGQSLSARQK